MAERFKAFKASVGEEVGRRRWFVSRGGIPLLAGLLVFAGVGALLAYLAIDGWRSVYPRWSDAVLLALAVCAFLNAAMLAGALTQRKLWRRRTREAEVEAERWDAFRRYLTDFPRLGEAPPASLALWERFLVYGIAFGIADRVLHAAHLYMPEDLRKRARSTDLAKATSAPAHGDVHRDYPPVRLRDRTQVIGSGGAAEASPRRGRRRAEEEAASLGRRASSVSLSSRLPHGRAPAGLDYEHIADSGADRLASAEPSGAARR